MLARDKYSSLLRKSVKRKLPKKIYNIGPWTGFVSFWTGFVLFWTSFVSFWTGFVSFWTSFVSFWTGFVSFWTGFISSWAGFGPVLSGFAESDSKSFSSCLSGTSGSCFFVVFGFRFRWSRGFSSTPSMVLAWPWPRLRLSVTFGLRMDPGAHGSKTYLWALTCLHF